MQPPKDSGFGKVMTMRRYKKLDSEIIHLDDGENPPAQKINPDYKQQPSNPMLNGQMIFCRQMVCHNRKWKMEWISIKDRLPPQDGSPFLGYDPNKENEGKIYVLIFVRAKKYPPGEFEKLSYEDHYLEASGEGYFKWEPTHWMPLPDFPVSQ